MKELQVGDYVAFKGTIKVGQITKIIPTSGSRKICEVLWNGSSRPYACYDYELESYSLPCSHSLNANTCYDCSLVKTQNYVTNASSTPITIKLPEKWNLPTAWDIGFSIKLKKCECGTKNALGQGHSQWCVLYRKEF